MVHLDIEDSMEKMVLLCGKRILEARLEKGLTQEELAHRVGCSVKYISSLENGERPSLFMIHKLHLVLEKSYEYFLVDTLFTSSDKVVKEEIAHKIDKLDAYSLHLVDGMLDSILERQKQFIEYAERFEKRNNHYRMK